MRREDELDSSQIYRRSRCGAPQEGGHFLPFGLSVYALVVRLGINHGMLDELDGCVAMGLFEYLISVGDMLYKVARFCLVT